MMPKQPDVDDEPYRVAWIILRAVKHVQVGRYRLAEFLKGSRAKDIESLKDKEGYGGLLWHTIATINKCVDQLEKQGLLRRKIIANYPHDYSLLELSEAGRKALEEKQPVPLRIIIEPKPVTVGDSERETYRLFKQGKTVADIMRERNLVQSTVYAHFYRLIVHKYLTSADVVQEEILRRVHEAAEKCADPTVKQLKEVLPDISYEEIRCALAGLQMEKQTNQEEK